MLSKLSSMSNRNYKFTFKEEKSPSFVVRINDIENSTKISRIVEEHNTNIAYKAGVTIKHGFTEHYKFSEYLSSRIFQADIPEDREKVLQVLGRLHSVSKKRFSNTLQPLWLASSYSSQESVYRDFLATAYENLKRTTSLPEMVPVHSDMVAENILITNKRAYLIDFEYAGNFYREWDLADWLCENKTLQSVETELLKRYDCISGYQVNIPLYFLCKCMSTFLWIHWADYYKDKKSCFTSHIDYEKYAREKTADLKRYIKEYQDVIK